MATPFTTYKLIVLYMLKHSETPPTNSQISEFILEKEYTNYFHLQQALSELVDAELVEKRTISNTSYYYLTEEGLRTLSFFEKDLSPDIKEEILDYLKTKGNEAEERILSTADYYETPQGGYAVRCQLIEKHVSLLDLNISAPSLEAAKSISRNWKNKCQDIYGTLMEELL